MDAHDSYLEAQVLTATPQKLRLMLLDGALAAARQTLHHWEQANPEAASQSLVRCRDIVTELLAGIQPEGSPLSRQVASVYVFVFQLLTESQLKRDAKPLENAIQILSVEQETWRMVCEKMPHAPVPDAAVAQQSREITSAEADRVLSGANAAAATMDSAPSGFVLDA